MLVYFKHIIDKMKINYIFEKKMFSMSHVELGWHVVQTKLFHRAIVKLDFFSMDQHHCLRGISLLQILVAEIPCPRSFRGIHTGRSKINLEVFKSVITSGNDRPSIPNPRKLFLVPFNWKFATLLIVRFSIILEDELLSEVSSTIKINQQKL